MTSKNIVIIFLGDIRFDSRCTKIIDTFLKNGNKVSVLMVLNLNRENGITDFNKNTNFKVIPIKLKMGIKVPFILFYIKAFFKITRIKSDLFFASDLYSLPIAYIASKLFKGSLVYDSRESYSNLASLKDKKVKQFIWKLIEKVFIKRAKTIFTVNKSISDLLKNSYSIPEPKLLYNFPSLSGISKKKDLKQILNIANDQKILLYNGGLQKGRGIQIMLDVIHELSNCVLVFQGQGALSDKIKSHNLYNNKVFLLDKITSYDLASYTSSADLGICIIENYGMSYYLSLPNKLFEYCHAGIPIIASNFPEISKFISKYNIGCIVNPEDKQEIIKSIINLIGNIALYQELKINCINATKELNWEIQENILLSSLNG